MKAAVLTLAVAAALAGAAPAPAADVSLTLGNTAGVRLGNATELAGRVTAAGAPLAGRTVRLEVRPHPFDGAWRRRGSARHRRRRRLRLRAAAAAQPPRARPARPAARRERPGLSPAADAYVLPAFTLSFASRGTRAVRLRQVYTVPRAVRLTAPTRFYLGAVRAGRRRGVHRGARAVRGAVADAPRARPGATRARAA